MTRSELIQKLTEKHRHLTQGGVEVIVKSILEHIGERLASGARIEFGDSARLASTVARHG